MIGKLLKALVKLGFTFLLVAAAIIMFFIWLIRGGVAYFEAATTPIPENDPSYCIGEPRKTSEENNDYTYDY